jgi:DNA polymerase III epsilon subunit-like protein
VINQNYYLVFDFETTGLQVPHYHEACQLAGKVYHPRTLEPVPPEQGGEFCSMMRALHPDRIDAGALAKNRKTVTEIMSAPEPAVVWRNFVEWVARFNPKKNWTTAPIACGKNIRKFDLPIVHWLNKEYCPKKEKTLLFSHQRDIELEDLLWPWVENDGEVERLSMDWLRDYFGMSKENSHDALTDTRQTGELIIRLLKLNRTLRERKTRDGVPLIQLKGSLSGVC